MKRFSISVVLAMVFLAAVFSLSYSQHQRKISEKPVATIPDDPQIIEFSVEPASVPRGGQVTFKWRVEPRVGGSPVTNIKINKKLDIIRTLEILNTSNPIGEQRYTFPQAIVKERAEFVLHATNRIGRTVSSGVVYVQVGSPDLTVESADITISPSTPHLGENISVSANIRNIGWVDTHDVSVRIILNLPSGKETTIRAETVSIAAKASRKILGSRNLTGPDFSTTGDYLAIIKIDEGNRIQESLENNNNAVKPFMVFAPDLSISPVNIITQVSDLYEGRDRKFRGLTVISRVLIRNISSGETRKPVVVQGNLLDASGRLIGTSSATTVQSISAFGFWVAEFPPFRGFESSGVVLTIGDSYILHVIVDPHNTITELDENNNRAEKLFVALR